MQFKVYLLKLIKLELVFWDNQSTDNSLKILKKYKDKRIKYFYAKIHNFYEVMNLAGKIKRKVRGFLDVDDVIKNKSIKFQKERKKLD